MADIFISYASEDRQRAEKLAKRLEEQGWSVWWDRSIRAGQYFDVVIEEAINAAKCVVVLWSKESVKSPWVRDEAFFGKEREIIIPAKIEPVDLPFGFERIHAADLTSDWEVNIGHPGFSSLLNAISSIVQPQLQEENGVQIAEIPDLDSENQSEIQPKKEEIHQPTSIQPEPAEPTEVYSEIEHRIGVFQISKNAAISSAKTVIFNDMISARSGDWTRYALHKNWIPIRNGLKKIDMEFKSLSGLFTKKPVINVRSSLQDIRVKWIPTGLPEKGSQKGFYKFEPNFSKKNPINAEINMDIPNAISFTIEQAKGFNVNLNNSSNNGELSNDNTLHDEENAVCNFSKILPEKLIWRIKFPDDSPILEPSIKVTDEKGINDNAEESYCLRNFHHLTGQNELVLSIDYPLADRNYEIVWRLLSEQELRRRKLNPQERNEFYSIRRFLLNLEKKDSLPDNIIGEWLDEMYCEITHCDLLDQHYEDIPLEVSISTLDESDGIVKYVGFYCHKCKDRDNSSIWYDKTPMGHPITGHVLKTKEPCFNLFPEEPDDLTKRYYRKRACITVQEENGEENNCKNNWLTSFLAIPIFYPIKSDSVVAVLEFATCAPHNPIFELDDSDEPERPFAKRQTYCYLANRSFKFFIEDNGDKIFKNE
jgi:hypothetical protein